MTVTRISPFVLLLTATLAIGFTENPADAQKLAIPQTIQKIPGPVTPPVQSGSRSSSLNFEDEVVEGMNRNPFDSLTHIGKNDDRNQKHLYRKKSNFRYEIKLNIREMGLLQ